MQKLRAENIDDEVVERSDSLKGKFTFCYLEFLFSPHLVTHFGVF